MVITEFVSAVAAAYIGVGLIPGQVLDQVNTEFAKRVDSARSCFYRVAGEPGSYGNPHNYSLDLLCNYRLVKVIREGEDTWEIIRG